MMKFYQAFILVILCIQLGHSQVDTTTFTFEDGTEIRYRMFKNTADEYPEWNITGGLLIAHNADHLIPGVSIAGNEEFGKFRLNGEAEYGFPIEIGGEDVWHSPLKPFHKNYEHFSGYVSFTFFEKNFDLEANIVMKEKYAPGKFGGLSSTAYMVKEQVATNGSWNLIAGYDYFGKRVATESGGLRPTDTSGNLQYQAVNVRSHNLRFGLSYRLRSYSVIGVDDHILSKYMDVDFYAVALVPMSREIDVAETQHMNLVENGYEEPEYNSLGFLIGISGINDYGGKHVMRMKISLEGGVLPGLDVNNLYFGLKFGVGLGERMFTETTAHKTPVLPE